MRGTACRAGNSHSDGARRRINTGSEGKDSFSFIPAPLDAREHDCVAPDPLSISFLSVLIELDDVTKEE